MSFYFLSFIYYGLFFTSFLFAVRVFTGQKLHISRVWKPLAINLIIHPLANVFYNMIPYGTHSTFLSMCIVLSIMYFCYSRIFPDLKKSTLILLAMVIDNLLNIFTAAFNCIYKTWFSALTLSQSLRIIILTLLSVIFIGLSIKLLQKHTNIIHYFQELFNNTKYTMIAIILLIISCSVFDGIIYTYQQSSDFNYQYAYILWIVAYSILLTILFFCAREISIKEQMRQSQALIVQYQTHLEHLEHIQKDLRMIHHDYKNLISGLYLQAEERSAEEIKCYIDEKLMKIDTEVQKEIKQMNYLSQIHSVEIKSLLLTKLSEMKLKEITFTLEVMNPLTQIHMDLKDFICCTGILLENAIEEAQKQEHGQIMMFFLQESENLTVLVKNSLHGKVDLQRINQHGYSQILNKYPNVIHETRTENGFLSQSFYIMSKQSNKVANL